MSHNHEIFCNLKDISSNDEIYSSPNSPKSLRSIDEDYIDMYIGLAGSMADGRVIVVAGMIPSYWHII